MPFVIPGARRGGRILAGALTLAALWAAPAQAAQIANPNNCTPEGTLSQAFAPLGDDNLYTPVSNAGLENGLDGWSIEGDASLTDDNEPWRIGGAGDEHSLALTAGATAVTPPICIDETYPSFRLFARNVGSPDGRLRIETLFLDEDGVIQSTGSVIHVRASDDWQPTDSVAIPVWTADTKATAAPVSFRFTAVGGADARYEIDDVYVDPWARK